MAPEWQDLLVSRTEDAQNQVMDMDIASALDILDLAHSVEAHIFDEDAEVWVARLNERASEIEPSIELLIQSGDTDAALNLAGALGIFWQDIGKVDDGHRITEALLRRADGNQRTDALARAYLVLGELAFRQGNQEEATTASLAARETNNVLEMAGDNLRLRTGATHMLAWAEYTAGNRPAAIARFEENAGLYGEAGDRIGAASELANLGDLAIEAGEFDRAMDYLRRAFATRGVKENRYLALSLIRSAGVLIVSQGNHELGLELIAASDQQYEDAGLIGDPGDDLTPRARKLARDALAGDASQVELRGRSHSFEEALDLAARTL